MTNFNVNGSLSARIRSGLHENEVPAILVEAENLVVGQECLGHRYQLSMSGVLRILDLAHVRSRIRSVAPGSSNWTPLRQVAGLKKLVTQPLSQDGVDDINSSYLQA